MRADVAIPAAPHATGGAEVSAYDVEIVTLKPALRADWTDVHRWALNSWIRSLLDGGLPGFAHGVTAPTYLARQHDLIARLLGTCELRLAVEPTAPDLYRGWALGSGGVVHYCFVKQQFRRQEIARALVKGFVDVDGELSYTHRLARYRGEVQTKLDDAGAIYNPYLLFGAVAGAGEPK